ncbi:MAG: hypothetical protein JSS98_19520 [Bacteroidetes bacterium]|nr:hypothetical protein [Bacteroidota bacterium]
MRYPVLSAIFALLLFCSCNKEKFNSVPSLKFSTVNNTDLYSGEVLKLTLTFTDAEGDVSDTIYVIKSVPGCALSGFSQAYKVPDFPSSKNQKGDISVLFGYNSNDPTLPDVKGPKCNMNDTAYFKFVLKDKQNHLSDTAVSPAIIIHK